MGFFLNADLRHSLSSLMTANLFVVPCSTHKLEISFTFIPPSLKRSGILSIPDDQAESWLIL